MLVNNTPVAFGLQFKSSDANGRADGKCQVHRSMN